MEKLLSLLLLFAGGMPVHAECLDKDRVRKEILERIEVRSTLPGRVPDLCDPKDLQRAVFAAILFLKDLPPLDSSPTDFNPMSITPSPYEFFLARTKGLVFEEDPSNGSCEGISSIYIPAGGGSQKRIHVCPGTRGLDTLILSSALLHDARHLEGPEYSHEMCAPGLSAGGFSCNRSFEQGGGYGINVEFQARLSRTPGVDPALRQRARTAAVVDLLRRFNDPPAGIRKGALLADESGRLTFYDGDAEEDTGLTLGDDSFLTVVSGLPTFFDRRSGDVKSFVFQPELLDASRDVLNDRFRELGPRERESLRGTHYGKDYACLLLGGTLECCGKDRVFFRKDVSALGATGFVYTEKSRIIQEKVAHLSRPDGRLVALPDSAEELRDGDPRSWPSRRTPFQVTALGQWPGRSEIALSADGKVMVYSQQSKQWSEVPALTGRRFKAMAAPFYWSARLNEL